MNQSHNNITQLKNLVTNQTHQKLENKSTLYVLKINRPNMSVWQAVRWETIIVACYDKLRIFWRYTLI